MISCVSSFFFPLLTNTCICLPPGAVYSVCYGGNCFLQKRFPGVKSLSLFPSQELNCKLVIQNGIFFSQFISIHKKFTVDSKKRTQKRKPSFGVLNFF